MMMALWGGVSIVGGLKMRSILPNGVLPEEAKQLPTVREIVEMECIPSTRRPILILDQTQGILSHLL